MLSVLDSLVEERIQQAIQEGKFQNLPGEGKPLRLSDYDFLNPEVWLSNKILKNAGFLPPWVELGWEIHREEQRLVAAQAEFEAWLVATRAALLPGAPVPGSERHAADAAFRSYLEHYVRTAEPLRDKIESFNAIVPVRVLERVSPWLDCQVEQMEQRYAALCRDLGWDPLEPQAVTRTRKTLGEPARDILRALHLLDLVRATATRRGTQLLKRSEKSGKSWRR